MVLLYKWDDGVAVVLLLLLVLVAVVGGPAFSLNATFVPQTSCQIMCFALNPPATQSFFVQLEAMASDGLLYLSWHGSRGVL